MVCLYIYIYIYIWGFKATVPIQFHSMERETHIVFTEDFFFFNFWTFESLLVCIVGVERQFHVG